MQDDSLEVPLAEGPIRYASSVGKRRGWQPYGNTVHPQVPGSKETTQVTERPVCPDVEAAFQWPDSVEADNGGRHRNVEDQHGGDPGESLCAAKARGDSNPGTANNAEDLRQNQIAQSQPALKLVLAAA